MDDTTRVDGRFAHQLHELTGGPAPDHRAAAAALLRQLPRGLGVQPDVTGEVVVNESGQVEIRYTQPR